MGFILSLASNDNSWSNGSEKKKKIMGEHEVFL